MERDEEFLLYLDLYMLRGGEVRVSCGGCVVLWAVDTSASL